MKVLIKLLISNLNLENFGYGLCYFVALNGRKNMLSVFLASCMKV